MSSPARLAATAGDPRRPDQVEQYAPPPPKGESEKLPNGMLLAALITGMLAMLLKQKALTWVALVFLLSAVARADRDLDTGQLLQTTVFNLVSFGATYVLPFFAKQRPTAPAPAEASA